MLRRVLALCLAIVALLFGCSRMDPVSTDRASTDVNPAIRADGSRFPAAFCPLAIGNRWLCERMATTQVVIDGQPPNPPEVEEWTIEFEQICRELLGGGEYVVEEERVSGSTGAWWTRYRQDATGLYVADIAAVTPPDCIGRLAAQREPASDDVWRAGLAQIKDDRVRASAQKAFADARRYIEMALSGARKVAGPNASGVPEITRLRYPLYPGQSWFIRDEPGFSFVAKVQALDVLNLALGRVPAYRITIDGPPVANGEITVVTWWGRCGYVGNEVHFEIEMTDEEGDRIGVLIGDVVEKVTDIDLVDLRPCTIEGE